MAENTGTGRRSMYDERASTPAGAAGLAAASATGAVTRLVELVEEADTAGYRRAIEVLRDDEQYRRWWSAREYPPEEQYWSSHARKQLADYLEGIARPLPGSAPAPASGVLVVCRACVFGGCKAHAGDGMGYRGSGAGDTSAD